MGLNSEIVEFWGVCVPREHPAKARRERRPVTLNRLDLPQRRLQGEQGVCGVKVLIRANEGTPPP